MNRNHLLFLFAALVATFAPAVELPHVFAFNHFNGTG